MNKKLKIALYSTFSIISLLIIVTVVHIFIAVSNKPNYSFYHMARVDFNSTVSEDKVKEVQNDLTQSKGFISSYFNKDYKTFVYTFDSRYTSADKLYSEVINNSIKENTRYVVTDEMKLRGCPVGGDNKFYSKLTTAVTSFIY